MQNESKDMRFVHFEVHVFCLVQVGQEVWKSPIGLCKFPFLENSSN
jgi:hypothetical protein